MALSNFGWQDSPSTATPEDSAELEAFGQHIGAYADSLFALALPKASPTATGVLTAPVLASSGGTGTLSGRFMGVTVGGSPSTGTFIARDFVVDETGLVSICTVGGTPGTWVTPSGGGGGGGGGGTGLVPTAKSATYTAASGDAVLATGTFTVTAPTPSSGAQFSVMNVSTGVITVARSGSSTITGPGASAATSITLGTKGANVTLISDGTNWYIDAGALDTGWVTPSFLNSWVAVSGSSFAHIQETVQSNLGNGTTTVFTITLSAVGAGHSLILRAASGSSLGAGVFTVHDSVSGVWAKVKAAGGGYYTDEIWQCVTNPGGNVTVTVTCPFAPDSQGAGLWLAEFSGIGAASQTSLATGTSTTPASTSLTPSPVPSLVLVAAVTQVPPTASPGSPWTDVVGPQAFTDNILPLAWQNTASGSPITTGWTLGSGVAWEVLAAAFPVAGGVSGFPTPAYRQVGTRVMCRGTFAPGGATGSSPFTFPVAPSGGGTRKYTIDANGNEPAQATVTSGGVLAISYPAGYTQISIDQIEFTVD